MSDLDKELKHLYCELAAMRRQLRSCYEYELADRYHAMMIEMLKLERVKAHRRAEHQEAK